MPILTWSEDLSVGNPAIDLQHRRLYDQVNELYDGIQADKSRDALMHIYISLLDYVETHFRSEEAIFKISDYGNAEDHCAEHRQILEQLESRKQQVEENGKAITLEEAQIIADWLSTHIPSWDHEYKEHI